MRSVAAQLSDALRTPPGDTPLLLTRRDDGDWEPTTYGAVADAAAELAAGLASLGIGPRSTVAIASENRREWLEADFACAFGDYMSVGLHAEWSTEKLADIAVRTEVKCIVVSRDAVARIGAALAHPLLARQKSAEHFRTLNTMHFTAFYL